MFNRRHSNDANPNLQSGRWYYVNPVDHYDQIDFGSDYSVPVTFSSIGYDPYTQFDCGGEESICLGTPYGHV